MKKKRRKYILDRGNSICKGPVSVGYRNLIVCEASIDVGGRKKEDGSKDRKQQNNEALEAVLRCCGFALKGLGKSLKGFKCH